MAKIISNTEKYKMHIIEANDENFSFLYPSSLKTLFVHEGVLKIEISKNEKYLVLGQNQGIVVSSGNNVKVIENSGLTFIVEQEQGNKPVLEIVDTNN